MRKFAPTRSVYNPPDRIKLGLVGSQPRIVPFPVGSADKRHVHSHARRALRGGVLAVEAAGGEHAIDHAEGPAPQHHYRTRGSDPRGHPIAQGEECSEHGYPEYGPAPLHFTRVRVTEPRHDEPKCPSQYLGTVLRLGDLLTRCLERT